MDIKFKAKKKASFEYVLVGDCFIYDNEIYLKIRPAGSDDNAFNLTTNKVMTIYRITNVEPLNVVLVEE